jgi:hypothetical protein
MKNEAIAVTIRIIGMVLTSVLIGSIILGLSGCKAVEKYKHSDQFAADCADKFPVKTDTTFIEGLPVHDTLVTYNYGVDTVTVIKEGQEIIRYVNRDRIINKTITIRKTDTVRQYIENTARIAAYQAEIDVSNKIIAKYKAKAKKRGKQALIAFSLLSAILVYSGLKLWGKVKDKLKI